MAKAVKNPAAPADGVAPTVAVIGGGLAGMTSALQLAKRGFDVTLFEATDVLGGNLSSIEVNGVFHDVYPHMFCPWYTNFWDMFESEIGPRDKHFDPRWGVKLLESDGHFIELENNNTLKAVWDNMNSGLASVPDLFLLGYSMLDLAATPFDRNRNNELENLDVNGFIYSRGYSTQSVARLQNYILMVIWSIQSELTAASSYQDFIKHTVAFPQKTPFCYLLKGPLQTKLIDPLEQKLVDYGCVVHKNAKATRVAMVGPDTHNGVTIYGKPQVTWGQVGGEGEQSRVFDYLILATTSHETARLALDGAAGQRLVDASPHLSQLQRLRSESIPVLNIYFKKKLPGVPNELFALAGSTHTYAEQSPIASEAADCDMTVLDLSQLWTDDPNMEGRTVLCLASSNRYALPGVGTDELGFLMIQHLHNYMPTFTPGAQWGDETADIEWDKTHFRDNQHHKLFLNEVGSWNVRPAADQPMQLPEVFLAGDYCRTDVDMATIEAAVQSGLLAAQGLQARYELDSGKKLGEPIVTAVHEVYSDAHFLAAKLALLPFAYIATAFSAQMDPGPPKKGGQLPANAYSPKTYSLLLPLAFTLDWWKTAYWLARRLAPSSAAALETEGLPGLVTLAREVASSAVEAVSGPRTPEGEFKPGERIVKAMTDFAAQAWRTAQAAFPQTTDSAHPAGEPRRRWRMKV